MTYMRYPLSRADTIAHAELFESAEDGKSEHFVRLHASYIVGIKEQVQLLNTQCDHRLTAWAENEAVVLPEQ